MENFIEPVLTATEAVKELKDEYQKKLLINNVKCSDPFILLDGWLPEEDSIKQWPMVLYPDIFNYLMFNPSELGSNHLNDYKNSKAFSFYKTGWLQKLSYHCISEESPFCAIKGECRHSQRINDTTHKLWLIIEKENAKIRSCHCTCMAGMSQTCNHVAVAMFRIEAAVRMGLTNPAQWFQINGFQIEKMFYLL